MARHRTASADPLPTRPRPTGSQPIRPQHQAAATARHVGGIPGRADQCHHRESRRHAVVHKPAALTLLRPPTRSDGRILLQHARCANRAAPAARRMGHLIMLSDEIQPKRSTSR